jgi:hypothetical protein
LPQLKRNNVTGIAHQKVTGEAFTKENVMELATKLIYGTEHAKKLESFKKIRNLATRDRGKMVAGCRWYKGFMSRNKDILKQGKCKVKDQKKRTWCTEENFANMYKGVYEAMVDAGIVVQHDAIFF